MIIKGLLASSKKMTENITGQKTSCVSFCYHAFLLIVIVCLASVMAYMFLGGIIKDFMVRIDIIKDIYLGIIGTSATFFGIAITWCFGCSAVETLRPKEPTQSVEPNTTAPSEAISE